MPRKLFCEISPLTYKISAQKCIIMRDIKDIPLLNKFAREKSCDKLEFLICGHNSLIRRRLGNVDMTLQENKATNLAIAAPKINNIIIKPGEIFSFWHLVGSCTEGKGYKAGMTIARGGVSKDIGGGMCQFTNLIHWMVLHTDMKIIEHHHHDQFDLFPDFNRQIPFGTGTSILYNYLDYRFLNDTEAVYQLITYTSGEYLCGEMRCERQQEFKYHIKVRDEYFSKEPDGTYRNGKVYRTKIDRATGNTVNEELIKVNHARVMYEIDINKK